MLLLKKSASQIIVLIALGSQLRNFFAIPTVVLRKLCQVTSIECIDCIVNSVMILKVNNWKEILTRKWYPAEGWSLRIWWLDSKSNSRPDIKILGREFKSLTESFQCGTGHLQSRHQTRCSNGLMYIDITFLLRCQFIDQIWWNPRPDVWSQEPRERIGGLVYKFRLKSSAGYQDPRPRVSDVRPDIRNSDIWRDVVISHVKKKDRTWLGQKTWLVSFISMTCLIH